MAAIKRDGAAAPRASTPTSDEAPSRDQAAQGSKGQTTDDAGIVAQHGAERKAAAAVIAHAAMAGLAVYELKDGRFLAAWGITRLMTDPAAVDAFLRRVGGAA